MRSSNSSSDSAKPLPALEHVRAGGMTRGSFILRGMLATAAVYSADAVTPFIRTALAQSDASDAAVLDFALRLEVLEATFYDEALRQVPGMTSSVRSVASTLRDHEHEHVTVITSTLLQLGINKSPPPKLAFGDSFSSERRFLEVSKQLEDTGVAAYNGAAPLVSSPSLLAVAGQIVQIEARHAAVVRDLLGEPITDGAFDKPKSMEQVARDAGPFIKG